ncbi:MAG: single-stranded DNA-binding protein [ANME-2 cluster archaeon]|nr:MAG: single-stranded DNA-binding protein [ANME-2 cluster archaeon]
MAELRLPRLNKVFLSGRITNDIEMRYTAKGTPVVRFSLAVDKSFKDATGQWQNQAIFIDVVAWEKWAEAVNNNAHKGSPVVLEGRIEARTYVDKDNNNRKVTEIIAEYIQFLEYKPKTEGAAQTGEHEETTPMPEDESAQSQVTNDDVPF